MKLLKKIASTLFLLGIVAALFFIRIPEDLYLVFFIMIILYVFIDWVNIISFLKFAIYGRPEEYEMDAMNRIYIIETITEDTYEMCPGIFLCCCKSKDEAESIFKEKYLDLPGIFPLQSIYSIREYVPEEGTLETLIEAKVL